MPEIEDIKKLSPEERIRKLKEVTEKDKKEIESAQKLIKQSEAEIEEERRMREQIPIPQMKAVDISQLFTQEEKDMYRAKQMVGPERGEEAEEKPLEQAVEEEEVKLTEEQQKEQQNQYMQALEGKPMENIYAGVANVIQEAEEKGYFTQGQRNFVDAAKEAAQEKGYTGETIQRRLRTSKAFGEEYKR